MKYKLYRTAGSDVPNAVMTVGVEPQVSFIFDPANTDAQQFAKWLQEGNRPEPAEEGGVVTDAWIAETIAKLAEGHEPLPADQE
jgi:hypothetical protein